MNRASCLLFPGPGWNPDGTQPGPGAHSWRTIATALQRHRALFCVSWAPCDALTGGLSVGAWLRAAPAPPRATRRGRLASVWLPCGPGFPPGPAWVPPGSRLGPARVPAGSRPGPARVPPAVRTAHCCRCWKFPHTRPPGRLRVLEASWSVLEHPGGILEMSWRFPERSWGILEPSRGCPGAFPRFSGSMIGALRKYHG